jgi:flagellar biosynthetic protein FliR
MAILEVEVFKLFALVMVRMSGLFVAAPIIGSGNVPVRAKAGLVAVSAMVITPGVSALAQDLPSAPMALGLMAIGELIIGLLLGFVMTLVFAAIQVAGQVMDMLAGFAMMNVFNPALETQVPIFGFFFFVIAALYLLATGGHIIMVQALIATFDHVPLGGFAVQPELLLTIVSWGSAMFWDAVIIAAPIAAALLLAYVTLGVMGRLVPQIQLFVVGFPLTIALSLLLAASVIGVYLTVIDDLYDQMFLNVEVVVEGMSS